MLARCMSFRWDEFTMTQTCCSTKVVSVSKANMKVNATMHVVLAQRLRG